MAHGAAGASSSRMTARARVRPQRRGVFRIGEECDVPLARLLEAGDLVYLDGAVAFEAALQPLRERLQFHEASAALRLRAGEYHAVSQRVRSKNFGRCGRCSSDATSMDLAIALRAGRGRPRARSRDSWALGHALPLDLVQRVPGAARGEIVPHQPEPEVVGEHVRARHESDNAGAANSVPSMTIHFKCRSASRCEVGASDRQRFFRRDVIRGDAATRAASLRSRQSNRCSAIFSAIQHIARSFIRSVHERGPLIDADTALALFLDSRERNLELVEERRKTPGRLHVADVGLGIARRLRNTVRTGSGPTGSRYTSISELGLGVPAARRRCGGRGGADSRATPAARPAPTRW